jgi:hypothetical protein
MKNYCHGNQFCGDLKPEFPNTRRNRYRGWIILKPIQERKIMNVHIQWFQHMVPCTWYIWLLKGRGVSLLATTSPSPPYPQPWEPLVIKFRIITKCIENLRSPEMSLHRIINTHLCFLFLVVYNKFVLIKKPQTMNGEMVGIQVYLKAKYVSFKSY